MAIKYSKIANFPYLDAFKAKLPITENTVFCFRKIAYADCKIVVDTIYSDKEIPPDIEVHEKVHLRRMGDDPDGWIKKYLESDEFRLQEELIAYKAQIDFFKDREAKNRCRREAANNLSSSLYGGTIGLISYADAYEKLCQK